LRIEFELDQNSIRFGSFGALLPPQFIKALKTNYQPLRHPNFLQNIPLIHNLLSCPEDIALLEKVLFELGSKYSPFELRLASLHRTHNRTLWSVNYVSWFTGVPCLFHRFDLVVGDRRLLFSLPRIQLRILGSLSAGDS